jgi:hypothetical protein
VTAAELSSPAAVVARPVHRVECPCSWVGYRRRPWCRDCPACAIDAAKLRPVWLAGCAPHRGRCCYLGHIWPPPGPMGQGWAGYRHAQHYLGTAASSGLLKVLRRVGSAEFDELTAGV